MRKVKQARRLRETIPGEARRKLKINLTNPVLVKKPKLQNLSRSPGSLPVLSLNLVWRTPSQKSHESPSAELQVFPEQSLPKIKRKTTVF